MVTNSTIAIQNIDGTVHQIYCHYDGYIEHNGRILKTYYNTAEKVKELIALGGMSSLAPNIVGSDAHSFDTPDKDVCVFYGRDRGESDVAVRTYLDIDTFRCQLYREEFDYLFIEAESTWYLCGENGELQSFDV